MKKGCFCTIVVFIALTMSCDNNSKEGFPLYGIRLEDSPEQVVYLMERAGFKKEGEFLDGNHISLSFSKNDTGAGFWFRDKKLWRINFDAGNSNFDTVTNELRLSSGYPSYYSADEKRATWLLKNNPVITRIDLSHNPGENCRIIIQRDRMAEIDEGWN